MDLETDLDALFKLPISEFTAARNALAARLKKSGRSADAEHVKSLAKPSISAWAVNQLYWNHRNAFNQLIAAGERVRQAQALQLAGKSVDLREPLTARRDALSGLSRRANELLRDAGHNATSDTMRRIATTLEGLSARSPGYGPRPGHLTQDVDPPGFESLAALVPGMATSGRPAESTRVIPFRSKSASTGPREDTRQARIALAKTALDAAEATLRDAQMKARNVAADLQAAAASVADAEKAHKEARQRHRKAEADAEKAGQALQDAKRGVEKARKELERQ